MLLLVCWECASSKRGDDDLQQNFQGRPAEACARSQHTVGTAENRLGGVGARMAGERLVRPCRSTSRHSHCSTRIALAAQAPVLHRIACRVSRRSSQALDV